MSAPLSHFLPVMTPDIVPGAGTASSHSGRKREGKPTEGQIPQPDQHCPAAGGERASRNPSSRLLVAKTKHSHCRKPSGVMDFRKKGHWVIDITLKAQIR